MKTNIKVVLVINTMLILCPVIYCQAQQDTIQEQAAATGQEPFRPLFSGQIQADAFHQSNGQTFMGLGVGFQLRLSKRVAISNFFSVGEGLNTKGSFLRSGPGHQVGVSVITSEDDCDSCSLGDQLLWLILKYPIGAALYLAIPETIQYDIPLTKQTTFNVFATPWTNIFQYNGTKRYYEQTNALEAGVGWRKFSQYSKRLRDAFSIRVGLRYNYDTKKMGFFGGLNAYIY